mgnify:CR=1 FL=1
MTKIAFVAPFYGAKAAGGAEAECRNTAIKLAESGVDVEIWTTCALDLSHGWEKNYYKEGTTIEDGLKVHRYSAAPIHVARFAELNSRLIAGEKLARKEEEQFISMHVSSPGLLRGLAANCHRFDWLCFIPYLFGTTYYGSMLCPEKSVLISCLHDEGYARMEIMHELFLGVKKIVYNASAEMELACRLYGDCCRDKGVVMGIGIETEFNSSAERFRSRYNIKDQFILYAGRKDPTKNVHTLINYFRAYKQCRKSSLKLVLIGASSLPIPRDMKGEIIDLGFLPDNDKKDAYSAAKALCQPSLNESFSIVMMEAWVCGIPCVVHGGCKVTREHVVKSGGGLYFTNAAEFGGCIDFFMANPSKATIMGECGKRYVEENFGWRNIVRRYREEIFA